MQTTTFRLTADDGMSQFVYRWSPDAGPAKAALLIAHGMAEHAGRYARVAEQLTAAGYVVYAGDHRGHGQSVSSPSEFGYFGDADGWQRLVQDLHRVRLRVEQEQPQLPLVVFGHSMGSMLVRSYMAQHGAGVAALVLSGTNGHAAAPSRLGRLIARAERLRLSPHGRSPVLQLLIVGPYNLQFRPTRTDSDWLSRDALEVDKYNADPLCGFALTAQGWIDFLGGIVDIERSETIDRIPKNIPVYLFAGARDPVGANTRGVRWFIERLRAAGVADITSKFYPDGRHESLNEVNRDEVQRDLVGWLDAALVREREPRGMSAQQIVVGLRSCLAEAIPAAEERQTLAQSLRAWASSRADLAPVIGKAASTIEAAGTRRELAVAAAQAMRVLMQAEAESAPAEPVVRLSSRERQRARVAREQDRALGAAKAPNAQLSIAQRPVESIAGVGPALGLALRARGLRTLADLVWWLPLGYHDERDIVPIDALREGVRQVTEGRVVQARSQPRGRGRAMAEVLLEPADREPGGPRLRFVWFRAPAGLVARFREGARFRVAGVVERYGGANSMTHPQTELLAADGAAQAAGVVPRYASVPGVPPETLVRVVARAVALGAATLPDAIPMRLRAEHGLPAIGATLHALHAPPAELDALALADWNGHCSPQHARLALEEFFLLELALHKRRSDEQGVAGEGLAPHVETVARARAALPFALTAAQARVSDEIAADLQSGRPMRRLLQGDVGSGKTAVAMLAAAHAVSAGAQAAFMAPTEVLAAQHFRALLPLAQAMGLRTALVLGGERASHRKQTRKALDEGRLDLVVGTHALLTEGVQFARLRLVIVDEQHRFGVGQRLRLVDKAHGVAPHLLVMTATPIPRSLALALHGDLAASVLDEMPPGRVPPTTRAYRSNERGEALRQLERGLENNGQAYVICPAIEPNEETDVRSALAVFDELSERFARWGVALLHGQLPAEEKQRAMERFVSGEAKVLVSTTIVEVGVDVAAANVMLVENAERFGLAQLHQLRGRVGRAGQRSACLLVHDAASDESRERIRILCECADGFRIAEEDLRLRGPGELFGRKQSGLPGFRFGDLRRDQPILLQAQALARDVIERDPELADPEHAGARAALSNLADSDRAVVKEEAG